MIARQEESGSLLSPRSPNFRSRKQPETEDRAGQTMEHHAAGSVNSQQDVNAPVQPGTTMLRREKSHYLHPSPAEVLPISHSILKPMFTVWCVLCALVVVAMLQFSTEADYDLFFIYYQPLIPVLVMLWLWGIAVRFFERKAVKYDVCFSSRDHKYLLNSRQIFQTASLMSTVIGTSAAAFTIHNVSGQKAAAAAHPPLMYAMIVVLVLLPAEIAFKGTRLFFANTLFRVVTPFREVTWADFLLADILTSLAKPLSDCERAVCHLLTGPVLLPASTEQTCGSNSWLIPLGLCLPYAWRFCQCIRVYRDTGAKPQVFNAIKYSTAFPVIILSAMQYQVTPEQWQNLYKPLWLASALLNSSYSYYWDIERDWEISFFSASSGERAFGLQKPVLKNELLYNRMFYLYLMGSNLLLRLSWTYKLSPHLRRDQFTVLCFTLLEVFRRFQWLFVRIEVELRKLQRLQPDLGQLVPAVPNDYTTIQQRQRPVDLI